MLLSLFLFGGVGAICRWTFGKQHWSVGLLFFFVLCPVAVVLLLGIYVELGYDASYITRAAGRDAIVGAVFGAVMLSSQFGWFGAGASNTKSDEPTASS
jgi:hypothetical protein